MTIRTLFMILALVVGAETTQPIESDSTTCPTGRVCRIGNNCWINGVWYNPCPSDPSPPPNPDPTPSPEVLLP